MTVGRLLCRLHYLGVQLAADGEELRLRAPAGVLTAEALECVREHKADVLAAIHSGLWDTIVAFDLGPCPTLRRPRRTRHARNVGHVSRAGGAG